jgi:hypothetical protein
MRRLWNVIVVSQWGVEGYTQFSDDIFSLLQNELYLYILFCHIHRQRLGKHCLKAGITAEVEVILLGNG